METQAEENARKETTALLQSHYTVTPADKVKFDYAPFFLLSYYQTEIVELFTISSPLASCMTGFLQVSYTYPGGRHGDVYNSELQSWITTRLKKDYGHILIKPETFLDRIKELFLHTELTFEGEDQFNRKISVTTTDKPRAMSAMTISFRNEILSVKCGDFLIEILGDILLIGNQKITVPEETLALVEIAMKLNNISQKTF